MIPSTRVLPVVLIPVLVLALGGCSGSVTIPGGDLVETALTMVLRVQDADGNPIGDARVYVDGDEDDLYTDPEFWALDGSFPAAWQGATANWYSDRWALYGDSTTPRGGRVELVVRKFGWTAGLTIAVIPDTPDTHFWIRDTLTLYPSGSIGPGPSPQYAEVLAAPRLTAAVTPPRHVGE